MTDTYLRRVDFQIELELLSSLHIGAGELIEGIREGRREEGARLDDKRQISAIVRDYEGKPYLPSTSLKGAFRRLLAGDEAAKQLFGFVTESKDVSSGVGALSFRGGKFAARGASVGTNSGEYGMFVLSRSKQDAGRGGTLSTGLFSKEMVSEGAVFKTLIRLEMRSSETEFSKAVAEARKYLSAASGIAGFALGGNTSDGDGRIRIREVHETFWETDPETLEFCACKASVVSLDSPEIDKAIRLRCECKGLFAILDGEYTPDPDGSSSAQLKGLEIEGDTGKVPVVSGSSVSGALRSRAEWLRQLSILRAGEVDCSNPDIVVKTRDDIKDLDPVQMLFGVTGKAAELMIGICDVKGANFSHTSNKIDRFSGAVMHNALFTIDASAGVSFELYLRFRRGDLPRDAHGHLEMLKNDLVKNGLKLGHGGSRGYGWFECEEISNG